jgi:hypothetical protein
MLASLAVAREPNASACAMPPSWAGGKFKRNMRELPCFQAAVLEAAAFLPHILSFAAQQFHFPITIKDKR